MCKQHAQGLTHTPISDALNQTRHNNRHITTSPPPPQTNNNNLQQNKLNDNGQSNNNKHQLTTAMTRTDDQSDGAQSTTLQTNQSICPNPGRPCPRLLCVHGLPPGGPKIVQLNTYCCLYRRCRLVSVCAIWIAAMFRMCGSMYFNIHVHRTYNLGNGDR